MKTPSVVIQRVEKALALTPLVATAWLAFTPVPAQAALTDIAPAPLASSSTAVVKPNILMILDDSGSMDSAFMPDYVTGNFCKDNSSSSGTLDNCQYGDPPYNGAAFNGLAYSPNVHYAPAVNADTTSKTNYNTAALWAVVPNDAYGIQFTGTLDLTQNYPDFVWCNTTSPSVSDRTPPYMSGKCKHPLAMGIGTQAWTYPDGTFTSRQAVANNTAPTVPLARSPFYYGIASVQWCQNRDALGFGTAPCQAKKTATFQYPLYGAISRTDIVADEVTTPFVTSTITEAVCTNDAPAGCGCSGGQMRKSVSTTTVTRTVVTRGARVISDTTGASSGPVVTFSGTCSGSAPALQSPNPSTTTNVPGAQSTTALFYPKSTTRPDCTGSVGATGCSFTEEMTNFANWYSYYRTRMQMMKTASGLAFKTINQNYRVGFLTINPGSPVSASKYLSIAPFEGLQRQSWYDKFYDQNPSSSTPLREALARAGRYFAGMGPGDTSAGSGINRGMNHDPIEYSCQQNFAILSTDGLWNTGNETVGPVSIDSTTLVGNQDGSTTTAPRPLLDGSNEKTITNATTTTLTQALCTGNSAVLGITCGCPANLKRIVQQTVVSTDTTTTPPGTTTNTSTTSYQTIFPVTAGVCDALQVGTQTPQTSVEIRFCKRGGTNPVNFTDGTSVGCGGCSSSRGFSVRNTLGKTFTSISYDGGAAVNSTTTNSQLLEYTTNGTTWSTTKPSGGSCVSSAPLSNVTTPQVTNGTPVVNINTGATVTAADATIPLNTPQSSTSSSSSSTSGTPNTLADVAQYYYITDLRGGTDSFGNATGPATSPSTPTTPGGNISENNVKGQTSADVQNDSAIWQHMTTFTVGLGVDGTLAYAPDYRTNPTGDFLLIKNGAANWPAPAANADTTVDDLWHSGVNGRGKYLSARDPAQLAAGLSDALASVNAVVGAAAAAATSNLEPVAGDNFAYIASYETVRWNGEVEARTIDLNTGAVSSVNQWSAQGQLDTLANSTATGGANRNIWRLKAGETDAGTGTDLQNFLYANLDATTEQIYFQTAHVSGGSGAAYPALSQWAALDPTTQQPLAVGANLVNFVRGDGSFEDNTAVTAVNRVFRDRVHVLGDIVNAQPVFVKKSSLGYTDTGYSNLGGFKDCVNVGGTAGSCVPITGTDTPRPATVYISSNDGMLHALNGDTGAERWAYIPNVLMPKLYRLADKDYKTAINHQWMVDGSPTVGDFFDGTKWRTLLVGGLNGGGRGYYALDVTNPLKPKGLWEFKVRTSGSCGFTVDDVDDCDLGFSYGNPVITKLGDGTWVVLIPSGYNNVTPGDGKGYLYVLDPLTGQIKKKIALANADQGIDPGDTVTPMGFARINNWVDDSSVNNTTLRVYGGDLLGNVWRVNPDDGTAYVIAQLKDGATPSVGQAVTTRPELGQVTGSSGSADMVYIATGKYLGAGDAATTQKQTIYAIKDATGGTAPATPIDARGGTVKAQTLTDTTDATGASIRTVTNSAVNVTSATTDGWRVDLPVSGERVNVDMKLQLGTLIVGSNVPESNACNAGGFSFLNFFDYRTGSYIPSASGNVAGQRVGNSLLVGINVVRLPNNKTVAIATTSDNQHPTLYPPFQSPNPVGRRVGWREISE